MNFLRNAILFTIAAVCFTAWTFIGLLYWIPILARTSAAFTAGVLMAAVANRSVDQVGIALDRAVVFYLNGFQRISESLSSVRQHGTPSATGHEVWTFEIAMIALKETSMALLFWLVVIVVFFHSEIFQTASKQLGVNVPSASRANVLVSNAGQKPKVSGTAVPSGRVQSIGTSGLPSDQMSRPSAVSPNSQPPSSNPDPGSDIMRAQDEQTRQGTQLSVTDPCLDAVQSAIRADIVPGDVTSDASPSESQDYPGRFECSAGDDQSNFIISFGWNCITGTVEECISIYNVYQLIGNIPKTIYSRQ